MKCSLPLLFLGLLLAAARGGEGNFYREGRWEEGQRGAAEAKLVLLGRVLEAGKAGGKGWDGSYDSGNRNYYTRTGKADIRQELVVEVTEVLSGRLEAKKVVVKLGEVRFKVMQMQQLWGQLVRKDKKLRSRRGLPVGFFAIKKGNTYLFFLEEPARGKGEKEGETWVSARHLEKTPPMEEPEGNLLTSVRSFCQAMAHWQSPPKLTEKENEVVEKLIAALGSEDYQAREAADRVLRVLGARLRPQLQKAAADGDEERSFRARKILEAVKPEPGKRELPQHAARGKLPAVFKERPEPTPEEPPEQEPAPVPGDD